MGINVEIPKHFQIISQVQWLTDVIQKTGSSDLEDHNSRQKIFYNTFSTKIKQGLVAHTCYPSQLGSINQRISSLT
jgi:hypothetical protein